MKVDSCKCNGLSPGKGAGLAISWVPPCRSRGPLDIEHFKNTVVREAEKMEEAMMKSWYPSIISLFSGEGGASGRGAGSGVHQCVSTLISNQVSVYMYVWKSNG